MRQKTFDNTDESGIFQVEQYRKFAEYVRYKEAGLRKEAIFHLNNFLDETASWSAEERRAFIRDFFAEPNAETRQKWSSFPLVDRLLIPAVLDWRKESPSDPIPYFAFADISTNLSGSIPRSQWCELVGDLSLEDDAYYDLQNHPEYLAARKAMILAPDVPAYRVLYIQILIRYLGNLYHNFYSGFPDVPFPSAELEDCRQQLDALPDNTPEKKNLVEEYYRSKSCLEEFKPKPNMPMHCKICQRGFDVETVRKGPVSQRELCPECLHLCRRQRQPSGPETIILHFLHQCLIAKGVVKEKQFVTWNDMPNLACPNTPKFWSESIFGDFLNRTYAVTFVYGGNKEQVAAFGRAIQTENKHRYPLESDHLFFQVDDVAEVKRPENNPSIGQFCVKISIVPNPNHG